MLNSSAGRPLTGRLGTGQAVPATPGQMAGYGVSLNTEVNVSDRPVTQQGMMGMRVGTAGPGRQVQDASYFMGKLHSKISEITTEVEKIRREIDQDAKDKSQYTQVRRIKVLFTTVLLYESIMYQNSWSVNMKCSQWKYVI
jgi:intraflagellar transport protein 74